MMIIKVENNKIVKRHVFLPTEFPNTSFPDPVTQDSLPEGYFIPLPPDQHVLNWDEQLVEIDPVFVDGIPKLTYQVVKKTLKEIEKIIADKKIQLAKLATDKRKILESQGITYLNSQFGTDPISQTKLIGIYLFASQDQNFSVRWKTQTGNFVTLNAAEIIQLVQEVRGFVQLCFDWESNIQDAIKSASAYADLIVLEEQITSKTI